MFVFHKHPSPKISDRLFISISKQTHAFGDTTDKFEYIYSYENYPDDKIAKISLTDKFTQTVSRDALGRTGTVSLDSGSALRINENYSYLNGNLYATETTEYIERVTYSVRTSSLTATSSDSYTYDKNGNIASSNTKRGKVTYAYDGLNRLTQEINNVLGKKYNYTYDAGGNILTKKVTDTATGQVTEQYGYSYDSTYKDRLIGFGNETVSGYDLQGRPTAYRGLSLTWTNGRVSAFAKNGLTQSCIYDADGIRTEKTVNGDTHKYYLEDNKIVREVVTGTNNYELWYMYGASGIVGFTYKTASGSANYYYRKNLQGDIVEIYSEGGALCAAYAYDAWGNCTIITATNNIAALNPYRYRGYYWDSELGLYYLNARYYDPLVGRFISQDSIKYIAPETLNGLNLFAYCLNNPVMGYDPDGTIFYFYLLFWAER